MSALDPKNDVKMTFLLWRDASHHVEPRVKEDTGLVDLFEIGFVWDETEEKVTLSCEEQSDSPEVRLWISVPKVNILERHEFTLGELKTWLRRRKRR